MNIRNPSCIAVFTNLLIRVAILFLKISYSVFKCVPLCICFYLFGWKIDEETWFCQTQLEIPPSQIPQLLNYILSKSKKPEWGLPILIPFHQSVSSKCIIKIYHLNQNVSSKCLFECLFKSLVKIPHQNVSLKCLIKMSHQNVASTFLIKMFHQISHWNVSSLHPLIPQYLKPQNPQSHNPPILDHIWPY